MNVPSVASTRVTGADTINYEVHRRERKEMGYADYGVQIFQGTLRAHSFFGLFWLRGRAPMLQLGK